MQDGLNVKSVGCAMETETPVHVSTIMEEWLAQQQLTQDALRAFHDYPESPQLLTAWVDAQEKLDTMTQPIPGQLELFEWDNP